MSRSGSDTGVQYERTVPFLDPGSYAPPVYMCVPPPAPRPQAARAYIQPQFMVPAYPPDAWYNAASLVPPHLQQHGWMPMPTTYALGPPMCAWDPHRHGYDQQHYGQAPRDGRDHSQEQHGPQHGHGRSQSFGFGHAHMPVHGLAPFHQSWGAASHETWNAWPPFPPPASYMLPSFSTQASVPNHRSDSTVSGAGLTQRVAASPVASAAAAVAAAPESAPPLPLEKTAVVLSDFGAEAVWKASAEIVGLRRSTTRSGARLSSFPEVRSLSPEALAHDENLSSSSHSSHSFAEPTTPPSPTPATAGKTLSEPTHEANLSPARDERSADLHRLVRAMGHMQQRPFPSLGHCSAHHSPMPSSERRARTPMKREREHSVLLGEVSPAFRHFTHQVLAQTLVSPMTLLLALHYVHMLQGTIWPDDGSGETHTALSLLAHPISTAPFKLLTLGLMMANKFLDDHTFLNKTWHEVTGIPLDELNRMESFFLCRTQFQLSVSDSAWRQHVQAVRAEVYVSESQEKNETTDSSKVVDTLDHILAAHVSGLCI